MKTFGYGITVHVVQSRKMSTKAKIRMSRWMSTDTSPTRIGYLSLFT